MPEMPELDPLKDLARALAELADLPVRKRKHEFKPGGSANVGPMETIAGPHCWCGRPNGHDWVGRDDGAPHPRYPD